MLYQPTEMKTLISCCILALHTCFLFASTSDLTDAERCLEQQLTSSNWAIDNGRQWAFSPDGVLLELDYSNSSFVQGEWELQLSGSALFLHVVLDKEEHFYTIAPRCDQQNIKLVEPLAGSICLIPIKFDSQFVKALAGDWQKGFYAAEEPFITFNADGHYLATTITNDDYQIETGRWLLTGDGKTLLLYNTKGTLRAFTIKHLQLDELVMSPFQRNGEDWYLNKL